MSESCENIVNSIKFDAKFNKPIQEGIKTSTIREHFNGKTGDKYECIITTDDGFGAIIGDIRIKHVQRIRFDEITKEKAVTEGYLHESLAKYELLNYYPNLTDSSLLYYIVFEYVQEDKWKSNTSTFKGGKK